VELFLGGCSIVWMALLLVSACYWSSKSFIFV